MKYPVIIALMMWLTPIFGHCDTAVTKIAENRQKVENLSANASLSSYLDTFDKPKSNQWDMAQLTYSKAQLTNFKRADLRYVNGGLEIETQKGFYSKAGYESRFTLSGDFDIQLDCKTKFSKNLSGMEERIVFSIGERNKDAWDADFAWIQLLNKPKWSKGLMDASCMLGKKFKTGKKIKINAFDGSLRLMRKSKKISMFYRSKNQSKWVKMTTMKYSSADMKIIFYVSNFTAKRKSVTSDKQFKATFDTFQINTAQNIIESDI